MEEKEENQSTKRDLGGNEYLNRHCWLVNNLNYAPYKRCQYCELKFRRCLFLQYQIISILLLLVSFSLFLLFEKKLSALTIIVIFISVAIYGYFFNSSTEKIIKANFYLKQTKNDLKELTDNLEAKVRGQTRDIRKKSQYLQELLNMKTDFLRVVNHQLNTPISIVRGAFSMMEEKIWGIDKSLVAIKDGFDRITQTVQDFWDAYELEGEKMAMKPGKTNLAAIIETLILEKQKLPLAVKRQLAVTISPPDFKIPLVWCDAKKITHVISNLLDNAVYYTERGQVTVSYELLGGRYLKVKVVDTGAGISDEDKKTLFQKFSRGKAASSLHPDGSGLGLYISRKIIESNDGEMIFSSRGVGQGSTFGFTVPIYQNQKPIAKAPAASKNKIIVFKKNNPA
ncbi:MAG: HAMP domain-containing sensor histidine kinase [Patescibacteria group bacterium]|nr:HAMP domain-containing sensor histidine kinase [Patescibacteria group bacterium]